MSKDRNTLFFNAENACYALDARSLQQTPINWPAGTRPINLHIDAEDKIWCALGTWMSCFDGNTYQDFVLDFPAEQFEGVLRSNHALLASSGELVAIPISKIRSAGKLSKSMADWKIPCPDAMLCKLEDSSGNVWVGQNGKGILKVNPASVSAAPFCWKLCVWCCFFGIEWSSISRASNKNARLSSKCLQQCRAYCPPKHFQSP